VTVSLLAIQRKARVPHHSDRQQRHPSGKFRSSPFRNAVPKHLRPKKKRKSPTMYTSAGALVHPNGRTNQANVAPDGSPSGPPAPVMNAVREVLRETRDDRLAEALLILAQRREEADAAAQACEAARGSSGGRRRASRLHGGCGSPTLVPLPAINAWKGHQAQHTSVPAA